MPASVSLQALISWAPAPGGGAGSLSLSYSWPRACGRISPSPHPRDLSLSLSSPVCLSLALSSCPHPSASGWGWGSWWGHLCLAAGLRLQVPCLWWGWGSSGSSLGLPIPVSVLSRSWLTLPIRPSQVSGLPESPSLALCPPPHVAPLRFSRTLSPSPDRLQDSGGRSWPFSWGRRRWEGAAPHLAPALPPPSPPARLYKANRPLYSAAPRAGLPEAAL